MSNKILPYCSLYNSSVITLCRLLFVTFVDSLLCFSVPSFRKTHVTIGWHKTIKLSLNLMVWHIHLPLLKSTVVYCVFIIVSLEKNPYTTVIFQLLCYHWVTAVLSNHVPTPDALHNIGIWVTAALHNHVQPCFAIAGTDLCRSKKGLG